MLSAPAQYVGMWLMLHRHRRRTPSPAIDNAPPARIPVAAHAMQSYYNFDVEGMQQRASRVLSSALVLHAYGPVNAGICELFIPCIEPERYRLDCRISLPDSESQS